MTWGGHLRELAAVLAVIAATFFIGRFFFYVLEVFWPNYTPGRVASNMIVISSMLLAAACVTFVLGPT